MELQEIKSMLPHGAVREIAKRIKLSESTVSCVLSGKKNSPRSSEILTVTAEYLQERKAKEQEARQKLDAILNE